MFFFHFTWQNTVRVCPKNTLFINRCSLRLAVLMKSVEEKGKVAFDSVKLRRWESKLEVPGLLVLEDFLQEKKKYG